MNDGRGCDRLAVCSWSLQPTDPQDLVAKLETVEISRIQLALDPLRESGQTWSAAGEVFRQAGITLVSGMFGCVGEDYSTLDSIRKTGGIAPDQAWEQNLQNIHAAARIAAQLKLPLVTFHAGFIPHVPTDPGYSKMLQRVGVVAEIFAARGIAVALETGQETAFALATFLQQLGRPDVGVNFDPANMILYDKGDPVEAVRVLGPWIRQVHIKDARRTRVAGTWGEEVVAGTGDVNWPAFFDVLKEVRFTGNLAIEREAGTQRLIDIRAARDLVQRLLD